MPLVPKRSVSSAASGAPDMRIWLRRFAAAIKSGHIIVEDRDSSQLTPLIPRKAQLTLLRKMIAMADAGKPIRIIISKARQQGLSTFIQDLYAWLCEHIPGYRALTTAHTAVDTAAIFRKATVCYENLPGHRLANVSGSSIEWPNGSAYMARTAGSKGIGRGDTYQLMHFSELAFCQRVAGMDERAITAAINTVPRQPHTIIVIESTGDGPSGIFYEWCMAGERGDGPFELLFFPWFDDDGYRETPPLDWVVPDDLIDLQREFDLDNAQMYYYSIRRAENKSKSGEVGTGDSWFKREYPSRVGDSFSAATGLVYPNFGSANIRDLGEPRGFGWEIYRGFDWGQTTDPTVCLWIAHDPTRPPGLIVHPSCTNTIREFQSYRLDEKTDYPKDKDNHSCDALRYVVVTEKLSGLVYVFQEYYKYNSAAIRLDGIAREVHAMTGWHVPHGSEMVIGSATPGPDAYIVKDSVADRSMPMYISMLSTWGIPCRGQRKPMVVVGVRERGEILDGCMLVSVLVGGTTKFYRDRIDVVQTAYERALSAINCHRPRRLTEEEKAAIEKVESQSHPDSLGKAKDPLLAGLYLGH